MPPVWQSRGRDASRTGCGFRYCVGMLPAQPAALTLKASAPAIAVKAKVHSLLSTSADADWNALRAELRKALALAEKQSGRLHPLPLSLRATAGLILDRQGEDRGLRMYAEACGSLHRQLRLMQRVHGPEAKEAIPILDALQELYGLEKFSTDHWEGLSLRTTLRHSKGPRPDLEKRLVAAIERHYGPFLSFRPPDRPALLEDVSMLLSLWSRREKPTREFMEVGLRGDARGVWKEVAAHAGESLRDRMKELLSSLDPEPLLEDPRGFLAWLPAQASSPWRAEARRLAESVDAVLGKSKLPPTSILQKRVRLARALGENERAVRLIAEALAEPREDRAAVFAVAEEQLREKDDPELARLLHEALLNDLAGVAADPAGRASLAADAQRLEAGGDFVTAEGLWRALLGVPGESEEALGRNLTTQRRWEEARFFFEALTALEKWKAEPSLRFRLAVAELGRGDAEAAKRWAREGLALLAEDGPVRPMAGLAAALRLLDGDPHSGGPAEAALDRARATLDPDGLVPALQDRTTLLALLEGLEQRPDKPPALGAKACGGPWIAVGEDPATKGMALLQAAGGLRLEDAEVCLREALRILEQAYPAQDPRLLLPLMRLARCLQDREDPGAEPLYRRILTIAADHPEADPMLELEARARLGQQLSDLGRDEEADALLKVAMDRLLKASSADPKVVEMLGGVVLMRIARLEYREQYLEAAQVLEQVETQWLRDTPESGKEIKLESELRDLTGPKTRFQRQARIQALLRAQGLP